MKKNSKCSLWNFSDWFFHSYKQPWEKQKVLWTNTLFQYQNNILNDPILVPWSVCKPSNEKLATKIVFTKYIGFLAIGNLGIAFHIHFFFSLSLCECSEPYVRRIVYPMFFINFTCAFSFAMDENPLLKLEKTSLDQHLIFPFNSIFFTRIRGLDISR